MVFKNSTCGCTLTISNPLAITEGMKINLAWDRGDENKVVKRVTLISKEKRDYFLVRKQFP